MCPRDFVHVTVLGVPSRATSGRGRAEPRHRCNSAPAAGGRGIPGRQAQRWDRPVTGESSPRTEYLEIVRQQIRHPMTSQKAQWEFREERAVKSRKSASILTQSSSPPATPGPSRETLKPHLRLHLGHTWNPGSEVTGGSQDLSACGHTLRGVQGSARPSPISADLRHYGEATAALSFPACWGSCGVRRSPEEKGLE